MSNVTTTKKLSNSHTYINQLNIEYEIIHYNSNSNE